MPPHALSRRGLQCGHCVFTLSVPMSAPCQHRLARRPARMAIGQHAVELASPFMCQHGRARRRASPFPCRNGIIRRAGKSIMQMLLWGIK